MKITATVSNGLAGAPKRYYKRASALFLLAENGGKRMFRACAIIFAGLWICISEPLRAQETPQAEPSTIETTDSAPADEQITNRIIDIFSQLDELSRVEVDVEAGVVTLSGVTATADAAIRAENLALRVDGVVTVENSIDRDVSVSTRLTPAISQLRQTADDIVKLLPLIALAMLVFFAITAVGWLLAAWTPFWRKITPNAFIAELVSSTMRAVFVILAAIAALRLLDAAALLGAFLGAAGVLGLAVGFAVRDTIENYIASVMLSLRQPFRPNDLVVINDQEGRVIRLTSRATILMTLQGNHLRIPNASVFKAVILNYSRNPERRFEFELGVDADDDPLAAMETGLAAIDALDFVLKEPKPTAFIQNVGDSNIIIFFAAWIDQRSADFSKSRSVALAAAKNALEDAGFALPEPIYRLRFDASAPAILQNAEGLTIDRRPAAPERDPPSVKPSPRTPERDVDVTPDTDIEEKVEEERRASGEEDLLTDDAPVE